MSRRISREATFFATSSSACPTASPSRSRWPPGLSGAVGSSQVIVTAGLAEITAGAIAMGLGGYLATRGDDEHYAERTRENLEVEEQPDVEEDEVGEIFEAYGVTPEESGRWWRA